MVKKRRTLLGLVAFSFVVIGLLVFVLGLGDTHTCSDPSQIIMKLYQEKNSHGALWDDVDYTYEICYDEIFGASYTGATPHPASCVSPVVKLYSAANSHAEIPSLSNYNTDVCYGNLNCQKLDSGVCSLLGAGYECVVTIYDDTNAHLAACGSAGAYDKKICCTGVALPPSVGGPVQWEDMDGVLLDGGAAQVEDSVGLFAGAVTGNTVEFRVYNDGDLIKSVAGDLNGDAIGIWTIDEDDIEGADLSKPFKFEVFVNGQDMSVESGELTVSDVPDDTEMTLEITSPDCGDDFLVGDVNVDFTASDEDDLITGKLFHLLLGDEQPVDITNDASVQTITHTYTSGGSYQIVLNATNTRGKFKKSIKNVMVEDPTDPDGTVYIAACIVKPEDLAYLPLSQVDFDASTTRALIMNSGSSSPVTYNGPDLKYTWTFSDVDSGTGQNIQHFGTGDAYIIFTKQFASTGNNWAKLLVEYVG